MIVVTGATGNVGAPLVAALLDAGEEVTAVARGITGAPPPARAVSADLAAPESLKPALDDVAAAAAAVLRRSAHGGRTFVLTGPRPISPREQAAAIAAAVGEPVRFVEQTREQARAALLAAMPAAVAEATLDILGAPTADEQRVSPHVEELTGRAPRSFTEWADRSAAAFR